MTNMGVRRQGWEQAHLEINMATQLCHHLERMVVLEVVIRQLIHH
jgi:hypothetical protein